MSAGRKTSVGPLGFTPPCLALATADPPKGDDWVHEIKFDGYRVQVLMDNGDVRLLTRNALDWTERFGAVTGELAKLPVRRAAIATP